MNNNAKYSVQNHTAQSDPAHGLGHGRASHYYPRPSSHVPNATYQHQPQYQQLQGFPPAQQYYAQPPYFSSTFNRLHSMEQGFIESDTSAQPSLDQPQIRIESRETSKLRTPSRPEVF
ncbi:hypothetical protein H633G_09818 [Metarhizium anisopliae BRIP 53284]|nr:hypothetical protein H633G_09818 [Metarhizium anisopliae BRIP 53284]